MSLLWLMILAAVLGSAAWLASTLSGTPLVGYDDANVFFVYARNLIGGHGFVFNAGGERVEGFTSLLWLLICAAARAITPRFEILLFAVNVALVSLALWWLHRFIVDLVRSSVTGFLLLAAVALTPAFVVWNVVSLMDSGLWSAVLVIAVVTVIRSAFDAQARRALPVLLIVLVLTRPESLLFGPVFIAVSMAIAVIVGTTWRTSLRLHIAPIAAFVVSAAVMLAWRLMYFGFPLPNTFYARMEPLSTRISAGFDYFSDFGLANPLVPLALVAGVVTTAITSRRVRVVADEDSRSLFAAQAGLLALTAVSCAVPIIEGGDRFGFWRLLQPVAPLAALQVAITAAALQRVKNHGGPAFLLTPATIVCVAGMLLALLPWRYWTVLDDSDYPSATTASGFWYTPRVEISIAGDMRDIGAAFTRAFPDVKPRVGVIVAGGFALEYAGPTIDLMGHNHVAMAHAPGPRSGPRAETAFQPEVFAALAPDVLLLSRWSPERDWFAFPMLAGDYDRPAHLVPEYFLRRAASMRIFDYGVLKGLLLRSQAGREYAWASVRPAGGQRWIHAIFNRGFLKVLEERGYDVAFATPPTR